MYYTTVKYDVAKLPMGIDTADVNGSINLDNPGAPKVSFGSARCGEGLYRDTEYNKTRAQYDKKGLPFIAYHVIYPGQKVSTFVKNFLNWAGTGCYGYSIDCEVKNGQTPSRISQDTRDATLGLLDAGVNVINYTTTSWINTYFRSPTTHELPDWVTKVKWWLAQYTKLGLTENNYLYIPTGMPIENVLIFQTWNKMPNKFGSVADSRYLDCDRWIYGVPTSVPSSEDEPVKTAKVIALAGVKIRTSPEVANNDTGKRYAYGTLITFIDTKTDKSGNIWLKTDLGWCCSKYGRYTYIKEA